MIEGQIEMHSQALYNLNSVADLKKCSGDNNNLIICF